MGFGAGLLVAAEVTVDCGLAVAVTVVNTGEGVVLDESSPELQAESSSADAAAVTSKSGPGCTRVEARSAVERATGRLLPMVMVHGRSMPWRIRSPVLACHQRAAR